MQGEMLLLWMILLSNVVISTSIDVFECRRSESIRVTINDSAIIRSPGYPETYKNNGPYSCYVRTEVPDQHFLRVQFTDVDLKPTSNSVEETRGCPTDNYLEVGDFRFDGRFCAASAKRPPDEIIFNQRSGISVDFEASRYDVLRPELNNNRGFSLTLKLFSEEPLPSQDQNTKCGGMLSETAGMIQSPRYPKEYRENKLCRWDITLESNYYIRITLEGSLEDNDGNGCIFDYLQINSATGDIRKVYCGNFTERLVVQSNTVTIIFKSDSSINGPGFTASYEGIDLTTDRLTFEGLNPVCISCMNDTAVLSQNMVTAIDLNVNKDDVIRKSKVDRFLILSTALQELFSDARTLDRAVESEPEKLRGYAKYSFASTFTLTNLLEIYYKLNNIRAEFAEMVALGTLNGLVSKQQIISLTEKLDQNSRLILSKLSFLRNLETVSPRSVIPGIFQNEITNLENDAKQIFDKMTTEVLKALQVLYDLEQIYTEAPDFVVKSSFSPYTQIGLVIESVAELASVLLQSTDVFLARIDKNLEKQLRKRANNWFKQPGGYLELILQVEKLSSLLKKVSKFRMVGNKNTSLDEFFKKHFSRISPLSDAKYVFRDIIDKL